MFGQYLDNNFGDLKAIAKRRMGFLRHYRFEFRTLYRNLLHERGNFFIHIQNWKVNEQFNIVCISCFGDWNNSETKMGLIIQDYDIEHMWLLGYPNPCKIEQS